MTVRTQRFLVMVVVLWVAMWLRVHRLVELPPGVHFDEAANGLLAGDIGLRGARPIFIEAYTGKEILFFYIVGGMMAVAGQSLFVLRLGAGFIGVVMVAAVAWLGKEICFFIPNARREEQFVGVGMAILVATNFVMVLFGRLGFRAGIQPLMQTLTLAALLCGVRTGKWKWFTVGSIFLGLTGYTYLAARLFPIVIGVLIVWLTSRFFLTRRNESAERFSSLILHITSFLGGATVVILPLLWFFWVNPDAFWVRIEQVSGDVDIWDYMRSYWESIGMIAFEGDPYVRFNVPGRGVLRPLVAIASGFGLIVMVWRRFWLGIMVVVAGVGVMLLPTALAIGEITPSNLRAIGIFPFVLLPFGFAIDWLLHHPKIRKFKCVNNFICLGLVVGLGLAVYNDYFGEWGGREEVFLETEGDLLAVAQYLDDELEDVGRIFVVSEHYQHPSLAFLSEKYDEIEWLVGGDALVLGDDGIVIYPKKVGVPQWADVFLQQKRIERKEFVSYDLGEKNLLWDTAVGADFSGAIVLDGYDIEQVDDVVNVRLYWTVGSGTERNVIPFVHLEDENGYRWAQNNSIGFLADQWRPGDQIVYNIELKTPQGMPSGEYRLKIGLFDGERLSIVDDSGRFAGTTVIVEEVLVEGNGNYSGQMSIVEVEQRVGNGTFLGHGGIVLAVEAGDSFPVELWWLDVESDVVMMMSDDIVDSWHVGSEFVVNQRVVDVPADLVAGMYNLRLLGHKGTESVEILLGEVEVLETERLFIQPEVEKEVGAVFEDEIELVGYTLADGQLEVVWNSLQAPHGDYTVFVHLLHPDGKCCVWQADMRPRQNQYPTGRWIKGEFVTERWNMDLPYESGIYPLEIGLYLAENGRRLFVYSLNGEKADHLDIFSVVVE